MAQAIVDEFELIKIDKGDGDLMPIAFRGHNGLFETVVQAISIGQSGQGIVIGLIFQPGFIALM